MKDRWSQLSLKDKSDLMSLYIRNGISSLEEIKKHYNSFATGGHLYQDGGPDDPLSWYKPLTVAGTTPETSSTTVVNTPTYHKTILAEAVRNQAEANAKAQGRRIPTQKDFDIARGQLTRQEDKPIEQNFNPITGERLYTKEEQDLGALQGAELMTEGLFWALDPVGMASYTISKPFANYLENKGINPALAEIVTGGLGAGLAHGMLNSIKSFKNTMLSKDLKLAEKYDIALNNQSLKDLHHSRFKIGDLETNNPDTYYHIDKGDKQGLFGYIGKGSYLENGYLVPSELDNGYPSYSWWNKGNLYTGKFLAPRVITTRDAENFLTRTHSKNPNEYISDKPVKIANEYKLLENPLRYEKILENDNTINLNDVLNTKISFTHVFPEEYLEPVVNSRHQSLVIPSIADTPVGWESNPVLFLNKDVKTKYPHQSYLGDGQTNTVGSVWGNNTDLRRFTIEELQKVLDENAEIVKTPYLPWKSNPVSDREMIFSSRLRKYLKDTNPDMYIGPNYDEMHFHSTIPFKEAKYAFLPDPETAPKLLPYFDKFGIKTNFDFAGEEGTSLEKFQKWITENDNSVGFRKGGKLNGR